MADLLVQFSGSEKKMSRSTITKILGAKNLLLEKISKNPDELSRKRNRGERYPFIENALLLWFEKARGFNLAVAEDLLRIKALELKKEFLLLLQCDEEKEDLSNFEASSGWIYKFCKRQDFIDYENVFQNEFPKDSEIIERILAESDVLDQQYSDSSGEEDENISISDGILHLERTVQFLE